MQKWLNCNFSFYGSRREILFSFYKDVQGVKAKHVSIFSFFLWNLFLGKLSKVKTET